MSDYDGTHGCFLHETSICTSNYQCVSLIWESGPWICTQSRMFGEIVSFGLHTHMSDRSPTGSAWKYVSFTYGWPQELFQNTFWIHIRMHSGCKCRQQTQNNTNYGSVDYHLRGPTVSCRSADSNYWARKIILSSWSKISQPLKCLPINSCMLTMDAAVCQQLSHLANSNNNSLAWKSTSIPMGLHRWKLSHLPWALPHQPNIKAFSKNRLKVHVGTIHTRQNIHVHKIIQDMQVEAMLWQPGRTPIVFIVTVAGKQAVEKVLAWLTGYPLDRCYTINPPRVIEVRGFQLIYGFWLFLIFLQFSFPIILLDVGIGLEWLRDLSEDVWKDSWLKQPSAKQSRIGPQNWFLNWASKYLCISWLCSQLLNWLQAVFVKLSCARYVFILNMFLRTFFTQTVICILWPQFNSVGNDIFWKAPLCWERPATFACSCRIKVSDKLHFVAKQSAKCFMCKIFSETY